MSINEEDIILEGSLKRCKRHKLFKTKWIERYFVLHCRDRARKLYAIDEYKSSRKNELKKRFNLEYVAKLESNLSFSDPSVSCSAGHLNEAMTWIFAIGFKFQGIQKDLYLVAKNDVEMSLWVNEICKLCKLHRQNDDIVMQEGDISQAGESSMSGMSMSSQSLDMSIVEQQQYTENMPDQKQYLRMHNFKSTNSHQSSPRDNNTNYSNLPDTRSETSSMYSSRRTEDDSVSFTSGPPIPPPRTRHILNRFVKNGQVSRLHMIPASTSMSEVVEKDADSSGETLKMDGPYPESVTSSEGISVYERNGRTLIRRAPPPVDRTNKPKNMRGEDDKRYRNLGGRHSSAENYSNSFTTRSTTTYQMPDPSKRKKDLDYFEPTQVVDKSSLSSAIANSTRSPTPSDIEYISVDVDRTLAFKQMRRGPATDFSI